MGQKCLVITQLIVRERSNLVWYMYYIVLQADLVKGGGRKNLPPMHVHVVKYSWLGTQLAWEKLGAITSHFVTELD